MLSALESLSLDVTTLAASPEDNKAARESIGPRGNLSCRAIATKFDRRSIFAGAGRISSNILSSFMEPSAGSGSVASKRRNSSFRMRSPERRRIPALLFAAASIADSSGSPLPYQA